MNSEEDFDHLSPEEKLQAENELLKLKLQAEFGMNNMDSSLNATAENQWLNYIYSFEKQFAENKRCKVYEFIGCPEFKNAEQLSPEEISSELVRLQEIMESKSLRLETICQYDDEVIYRFITEELFAYETDDIRVQGMMTNFIYEEFHPNHDYDLRKCADEFVKFLIEMDWDEYMTGIYIAENVFYNSSAQSNKVFREIIQAFQTAHPKRELHKWKIQGLVFDLVSDTAELEGYIKYKSNATNQVYEGQVLLGFQMKYDLWSVSKVVLPGFSN